MSQETLEISMILAFGCAGSSRRRRTQTKVEAFFSPGISGARLRTFLLVHLVLPRTRRPGHWSNHLGLLQSGTLLLFVLNILFF